LQQVISNGIKSGLLEKLEDFVNVYKGIYRVGSDDISYKANLSRVLRNFLVSLVSEDTTDLTEVKARKEKAIALLDQIEKESPFADLPSAERGLIFDIEKFAASGDADGTKQKLSELAGHIQARQESLQYERQLSRWSIPLAVIGLVLTIVFGIISIFK